MNCRVIENQTLKPEWDYMFNLLVAYKKREGHSNVPQMHVEHGRNLGNWTIRQRQTKKRGSLIGGLDKERVARLDEIDFVWDMAADQWETNFQLLIKYHEREGHFNVPRLFVEKDGSKLGGWLDKQRQAKKRGSLDIKREVRLDKLGITWDVFTVQWEGSYQLLIAFYEREGHCNVPKRHAEDGFKLGSWIIRQR